MPKRRKPTKDKERKDRLRRERHTRRTPPPTDPPVAPGKILPFPGLPRDDDLPGSTTPRPLRRMDMERTIRRIRQYTKGREFETPEDMTAELNKLVGRNLADGWADDGDDPALQAQELAYLSMEAEDPVHAASLARQALDLDPCCVDALCQRTLHTARSNDEFIAGYSKAVEAGRQTLGDAFFEDNRGHFWALVETRPYMRARFALARELWTDHRRLEAIRHAEELRELNEGDNMGIRFLLVAWYLCLGELPAARQLLDAHRDDSGATMVWARTLERLISRDEKGAAKALRSARRKNRFVEKYIAGDEELPDAMPRSYELGSPEEAVVIVSDLGQAWYHHPLAKLWLVDQLPPTNYDAAVARALDLPELSGDAARVAERFPDFAYWPLQWPDDPDDIGRAVEIRDALVPFILHLFARDYVPATLSRHVASLWHLGGHVTRRGTRGLDASSLLRGAVSDAGGSADIAIDAPTTLRTFHATCRQLHRFLAGGAEG